MQWLTVPQRRFDAGQLTVQMSLRDGRVSGGYRNCWRSFACDLIGCSAPVPAAVTKEARAAQVQAVSPRHWAELTENSVCNVRPSELANASSRLASRAALGPAMASHLGGQARWLRLTAEMNYTWLVCHEVEHHVDDGLGESAAFLVWHVSGPEKCVVLPTLGAAMHMGPGDVLVFDGMLPHAVRTVGKEGRPFRKSTKERVVPTDASDVTAFLSIDLPLDKRLMERLGIECREQVDEFGDGRSFAYEVNSLNGVMRVREG